MDAMSMVQLAVASGTTVKWRRRQGLALEYDGAKAAMLARPLMPFICCDLTDSNPPLRCAVCGGDGGRKGISADHRCIRRACAQAVLACTAEGPRKRRRLATERDPEAPDQGPSHASSSSSAASQPAAAAAAETRAGAPGVCPRCELQRLGRKIRGGGPQHHRWKAACAKRLDPRWAPRPAGQAAPAGQGQAAPAATPEHFSSA